MPILGAANISTSAVAVIDGVHDSMMEGLGSQDLDFTTTTETSAAAAGGATTEESEGQPPNKKMYGIGFCIITCSCLLNKSALTVDNFYHSYTQFG